jgi:spore coat protein H
MIELLTALHSPVRLLLAIVLLLSFTPETPAADKKKAPKSVPGEKLFADPVIRTFKISLQDSNLSQLKKNERAYVRATVTEGTNVFHNVGVHLKGNGSFQPLNAKPSLVIKFDQYDEDLDYEGLNKIALNNSSQDGTYLGELLAWQICKDAGVPAARVTHARVEFNGRKLGLYVLIESMNKTFLKQHFKSAKGNLYEAYLADIDSKMDQDNGTNTTQADVKKLLEICRIATPTERWQRLSDVLEVDKFISHQVCEMFTSHTDGYAMNRNNYRIYNDPTTGRFTFIPLGMDWAFQNTGVAVRPPMNSIVTRAVLETPEGRRRYGERLREIFSNNFKLDVLSNRIDAALIRLKQNAVSGNEAKQFEQFAAEKRNQVIARHAHIAKLLTMAEPAPLAFDATGTGKPTGWQTVRQSGEAALDIGEQEGRSVYFIKAGNGGCVASWRTRVLLPAGRYKFTAQARGAQIMPAGNESGVGAGVRISGDQRRNKLVGDAGWTSIEHEFTVVDGGEEKELVCELRAAKGAVYFDAASLRLVRQ